MGKLSYGQGPVDRGRMTFNVPAISGQYASEVIDLGRPGSTQGAAESLREVSALVEVLVAGASVELWLPIVPDGTTAAGARTNASHYFNSNVTPLSTQALGRWIVSAWPSAQLRVKSGGTSGAMTVSASCY